VLAPFGVVDAGSAVPLPLLAQITARLGGPASIVELRDVLAFCGDILTRAAAGTLDETVALLHAHLAEVIQGEVLVEPYTVSTVRSAVLEVLAEAAPHSRPGSESSEEQFARTVRPSLLWDEGRYEDAIDAAAHYPVGNPAENLAIWTVWVQRTVEVTGPLSRAALLAKNHRAYWTGLVGRKPEARSEFQALVTESRAALGPTDPLTLFFRRNAASLEGMAGDPGAAVLELRNVVEELQAHGPVDEFELFVAQANLTGYLADTGRTTEALARWASLIPEAERQLGADDESVLQARKAEAVWLARARDPGEGLARLEVLVERFRSVGADDLALQARVSEAQIIGEGGDPRRAAEILEEVVAAATTTLGSSHPETLDHKGWQAWWLASCGRRPEATAILDRLYEQQVDALGPNSEQALRTLLQRARVLGDDGDVPGRLAKLSELSRRAVPALGENHHLVLEIEYAMLMDELHLGAFEVAWRHAKDLKPRFVRVYGELHSRTLDLRGKGAFAQANRDPGSAARELREILRLCSGDHDGRDEALVPRLRFELAMVQGRLDPPEKTLRTLLGLRDGLGRVLSADADEVVMLDAMVAYYQVECGEPLARFARNAAASRVRLHFGRRHPQTVTFRQMCEKQDQAYRAPADG
jgi:hypothetical protein